MGKLDLKKQKSNLFFFKQSFLFSSFLKVSVTYQHSKNSGQKILYSCLFVYLLACLPLQNQKYVIL
jgi:hypothetical protein